MHPFKISYHKQSSTNIPSFQKSVKLPIFLPCPGHSALWIFFIFFSLRVLNDRSYLLFEFSVQCFLFSSAISWNSFSISIPSINDEHQRITSSVWALTVLNISATGAAPSQVLWGWRDGLEEWQLQGGGDGYVRFDEMVTAGWVGKGRLMQRKEYKQSHGGPCSRVTGLRDGQADVSSLCVQWSLDYSIEMTELKEGL